MKLAELLGESRSKKKRTEKQVKPIWFEEPVDTEISDKAGGGKLSMSCSIKPETDEIVGYKLAYMNPNIFDGDNYRVLGYDNKHKYCHKHLFGKITPGPEVATITDWLKLRERFLTEQRVHAEEYMEKSKRKKMTKTNEDVETQELSEVELLEFDREIKRVHAEFRKKGKLMEAFLKGEPLPTSPDIITLTPEEYRAGKYRSPNNWCSMHWDE